ncbi:hypothetical protein [Candidatus Binatus sp.]|uniref:hypothetical protein n=1 Tax=Candidatus Binatus sp. TaxID=2811406 RepID=UPI003BB0BAE5
MPSQDELTNLTTSAKVSRVQSDSLSLVRFIDQSILKLEKEIAKMRKARAVLTAKDTGPQDESALTTANEAEVKIVANPARKTDSIGAHLIAVLREDGRPLAMKTIHERISARGKLAEYHALSSMVAYYVKRGYVVKAGPNKYQIATVRELTNGAPIPTMTNGAPVPKNGAP